MATDSKERARADAALRDAERFRSMADTAPAMLWITEPDGECTFLSHEWYDFTGQPKSDALGAGGSTPCTPTTALPRRCVRGGHARSACLHPRIPPTAPRRRLSLGHRLRPAALRRRRRLLGYVGTVIDITERKQTERDVRRSREQLELLSDTVPALISYVGTDRRYRTCNAEYSKWFGLPREEIVGRSMEDVLGPEAWRVVGPHSSERLRASRPSTRPRSTIVTAASAGSTRAIRRIATTTATSSASCASSRTSRRAGRRGTRVRGSRRSSTPPTTRSSARRWTASITSWNAGAARLFGYTRRGGRRPAHHDADPRGAASRGAADPRAHPSRRGRRRPTRRSAGARTARCSTYRCPSRRSSTRAGGIVGASKIARDITARKRAEAGRAPQSRGAERPHRPRAVRHLHRRQRPQDRADERALAGGRVLQRSARSSAATSKTSCALLWPEPVATEIVAAFRETLETGEAYRSRNFLSPRADTDNVESYEWELHRITLPDGKLGRRLVLLRYDAAAQSRAGVCARRTGARTSSSRRWRTSCAIRSRRFATACRSCAWRAAIRRRRCRCTRCSSARSITWCGSSTTSWRSRA